MDPILIAAIIGAVGAVAAAIAGAWLTKVHRKSGKVMLESFSINHEKCRYEEYTFDPNKPFWPKEDKGAVTLCGAESAYEIGLHGKFFKSYAEAYAYSDMLKRTRNHRSFSKYSTHTKYFERLHTDDQNDPNYPNFYLSISNNTASPVILKYMKAVLENVQGLLGSGASQALESIKTYWIKVSPRGGAERVSMIPNLRIEAGDAVAFDVFLIPETERMGGYAWTMRLRIYYSENDFVETDSFIVIM